MKSLASAPLKHQETLTTLFIFNVGRPISATVNDGTVWKGILEAYRNEGLIIRKKYGKVLWNWPFKHLKQIEVEVPLHNGIKLITMPDY